MSETNSHNSLLADVYRTMDALSLQHAPNLGVPTEVRMFGAEISAEVASLSDQSVVDLAIEIDSAAKETGSKDEPLGRAFARNRSQPPAAHAADPTQAEAWAIRQLRIGLVSRRFRTEYSQRFPERAGAGYERSEAFMQGSVVAFRTIGQFLSQPM